MLVWNLSDKLSGLKAGSLGGSGGAKEAPNLDARVKVTGAAVAALHLERIMRPGSCCMLGVQHARHAETCSTCPAHVYYSLAR